MIKQKRGFWTFLFSLIPGAGEMHMGFMKQGMSIMIIFWGLIGLGVVFNTSIFMLGIPLLWFYSFFRVHNLKGLSEEEFYSMEDDYAFHLETFIVDKKSFTKKYRGILSLILIFIGFAILWDNFYRLMVYIAPDYMLSMIYQFGDMVPQVILGMGIIIAGFLMIRGKKKELEDNENA